MDTLTQKKWWDTPEAAKPKPQPKPETKLSPIMRQYMNILHANGWRGRYNPFSNVPTFGRNEFDRRDHTIQLTPEGGWEHMIAGLMSYSGTTPEQLYNHLQMHG